jgi:hypothetical protein
MKLLRSLPFPKKFVGLMLLFTGLAALPLKAAPITVSYDFSFEWNTFYPTEKVTGSLTLTVEPPPAAFIGYTSSGATLDAFDFEIAGQGLEPADTNYLKMLFISGNLTYLLVSDRADFHLSAIPPKKAGYVLGLQAQDLLTGTGIKYGSFGSTFSYYFDHRRGVDVVYTDDIKDILKVANPVPQPPPVATVPDTAGTLGLLSVSLLSLAAFRRRVRA